MDGSATPVGGGQRGGRPAERASTVALLRIAWITLAILSVSYGSPLLIVVGMRTMQEALGTDRSVIAPAGSLVWSAPGLAAS
ncbi:MAG: hypothetical protein U1E60_09070 [Reyranellaceae bacterium]